MSIATEETDRDAASAADACFRCGYDLRGVADDQPCPECGLLAERSRHPSDALHDSRPGWLRRLAWGVRVMLLALVVAVVAPAIATVAAELIAYSPQRRALYHSLRRHATWVGFDAAALMLLAGVVLLTGAEGYPPADAADARRRRWLRRLALLPPLALALHHVLVQLQVNAMLASWRFQLQPDWRFVITYALLTFGMAAFPLLLFLQLRSLATRARSAHLAEHCAIVGVGNSLALVYVGTVVVLAEFADVLGLGGHWAARSPVALGMLTAVGAVAILFGLWNVYVLIRFSFAFGAAAKKLRQAWRVADRGTTTG